ncbi:hypothetical protein XELAEV_18037816mg [Xenopus laevis]|uniref:Uncharacterized protein n=1 Tax=Xenopus laevis TaxID=8355 RepID=A0A974HAZ0_XENLA|nr:hypothetical protein XELAEV_18037816mg [Xenopus laevis]
MNSIGYVLLRGSRVHYFQRCRETLYSNILFIVIFCRELLARYPLPASRHPLQNGGTAALICLIPGPKHDAPAACRSPPAAPPLLLGSCSTPPGLSWAPDNAQNRQSAAGKLPVCAPFPAEGERCRIQPISLFNLLQTDSTAESELSYCPCAAGLVCTNNGFNLISTCEKPEEVLDFTTYGTESLLQPLVRRDEELTYYDSDLIPWPSQPDQLMVNLPRAAEESARESEHVLKALSEDVAGNLEEESLHLDQHTHEQPDPSPLEFLELKQLAKNIGQYGFY